MTHCMTSNKWSFAESNVVKEILSNHCKHRTFTIKLNHIMYLVICWNLSRDSNMLLLIMVVKFALASVFKGVICPSSFTYVTWLDKGFTKSEFLPYNSWSTPCNWRRSEMVPVPNKAFETVPRKSNRLCRRCNGGKNEEIVKFGRQGLQKCFNLF